MFKRILASSTDTQDAEALLKDISSDAQWDIGGKDVLDIHKLMDQVKSSLPPDYEDNIRPIKEDHLPQADVDNGRRKAIDMACSSKSAVFASETDVENSDGEKESEEDADEVLQRILDELRADEACGMQGETVPEVVNTLVPDEARTTPDRPPPTSRSLSTSEDILNLPATPSNLPQSPDQTLDTNAVTPDDAHTSDVDERLAALSLPSVPTFAPTTKPPSHLSYLNQPSDSPDLEDEISNWCCICNDDARVKCLDCDGDPYCSECWKEAHFGDGADEFEKKHRAIAFSKDGGSDKAKKKALAS